MKYIIKQKPTIKSDVSVSLRECLSLVFACLCKTRSLLIKSEIHVNILILLRLQYIFQQENMHQIRHWFQTTYLCVESHSELESWRFLSPKQEKDRITVRFPCRSITNPTRLQCGSPHKCACMVHEEYCHPQGHARRFMIVKVLTFLNLLIWK